MGLWRIIDERDVYFQKDWNQPSILAVGSEYETFLEIYLKCAQFPERNKQKPSKNLFLLKSQSIWAGLDSSIFYN